MKFQPTRRMITFWRILKAGLNNYVRNAWLSTAATAVMVVTLTIILGGFAMTLALNYTVEEITDKIDISVFFDDSVTEDQRTELRRELLALENVRDVQYVSKDDALERYRTQNANSPELLEAIDEDNNPLPTSFEVKVYDLSDLQPIVDVTSREQYQSFIEDTSYEEERQKTVDRIAGASKFITRSSIVAGGVFAFISTLIIFNTIRMAVFNRSEEIYIMRLVGATGSFIRGPFIFESMLYGIISSIVSFFVTFTALKTLGPKVSTHIRFDKVIDFFNLNWLTIFSLVFAVGIIIGVFSSLLSMKRYLKI